MESIDDLLKQDLSPEDLEKLAPVVKYSIFLRNRIKANRDLIALALTKESTPRTKDVILKELTQSDILGMDEHQFMHFLRVYKYVEYILIAIEELYYNKDVKETTSHLSAFASAMLEIAYRYAHNDLVAKYGLPLDDGGKQVNFAIIGLGKLGGWELNFSSDIDLIYVYDTEKGKTEGGKGKTQISNHEFFVKLGGKIKYYLSELTPDGFVYRVDLRLRPDGDRGPLAMPLRSYETYYESYGQSWERMMLLKGTTVAGDKEVGEKFLSSVKPFIFRRSIDYKLINDLLDVKGKIASRVRLKGDKKDVKLGYGGIREIEFIVQAIQILNYPKNPDVYHKNTLESIDRLTHFGLLSREEGEILSTSYKFLRKLEHMAQIENEQQTHTIPETSERFDLYLERCGFADADVFYKRYEEVTNNVNKIFNSIISEEKPSLAKILSDEELEIEDLKECFLIMGFSNPETVAEITRKIVARKGGRLLGQSETNLLFKLLEIILKEIKDIKNPEKVLNFFDRFFMRPDAVYLFYDIFASAPQILKKLISIIDYSNYLPGLILQNRNLLDYIYDPKNSNYRSEDILEIFKNDISRTDNEEFEYNLTRRKFQELFFNVAYAYLNSEINVVKCCKSLTELAKGILNFAFQREYEKLLPRMGAPLNKSGNRCDYLILGMGKLGSGEISFGSDLDIIVLYEEEGHTDKGDRTNQEFFSKLVQRVISYLATPTVYGILYTIDMRLRPSGAKGALVTTFKSFSEYQYKKAMLWEKQALLRAGVINQESTMKEMFERLVTDVIFAKSIEANQIEEIYDMRMRIQREKGEPFEINDIKAGFGGIIDVEFAIQMIQLKYGKDFPALRQKNSHDLLHAMLQAGIIKNRDYYALHNNYLFFRNVENIMRVYENKAISRLPKNQDLLEKIARFLNFKNTEKLLTQINEGRKTVRNAFNRIFEQEKSTGIV